MKTIFILLVTAVFIGCDTPVGDTLQIVDLTIIKTETPKTSTVLDSINSRVRCTASDLCYNFYRFDVRKPSSFVYEVHAKGTYPLGKPICLQTIYQKDTTVKFEALLAGQYILKFYNGAGLFKADTVLVN